MARGHLAVVVFAVMPALAAAAVPIPVDVPRFEMANAYTTHVEVRFQNAPSGEAGRDDDPGPHVASGVVAIVNGPSRANSADTIFDLKALAAVPPNVSQIVPGDVKSACGASGAIAIEPLAGSRAPAVEIVTVAIGKGCEPLLHTFVPTSPVSQAYAYLKTYARPNAGTPQIAAANTPASSVFRVTSIRTFALPHVAPDAQMHGARVAVVDGRIGGTTMTVALDLRALPAPAPGALYVLTPPKNGFEGIATRMMRP